MANVQTACGRSTHGHCPCPAAAEQTDGELLERFASRQDETAFAILVERHGPMVLSVCRRILDNEHDAEDAFQATFLVLVRRADSLKNPELLGSWLYGVAYRTARKARAQAARRRQQERQAASVATAEEPLTDLTWRELRSTLDEELNRLPDKYRLPLILCYLQGLTNEEAARRLGWPPGSMSYRLARGRELLRERMLGRNRLALAVGSRTATLPAPLADATVRAAVLTASGQTNGLAAVSAGARSLAEATLQGMTAVRRKFWVLLLGIAAAVVLAFSLLVTVTGRPAAGLGDSPLPSAGAQLPSSVSGTPPPGASPAANGANAAPGLPVNRLTPCHAP
jgi:polysaccharide export outer membrane protein